MGFQRRSLIPNLDARWAVSGAWAGVNQTPLFSPLFHAWVKLDEAPKDKIKRPGCWRWMALRPYRRKDDGSLKIPRAMVIVTDADSDDPDVAADFAAKESDRWNIRVSPLVWEILRPKDWRCVVPRQFDL